MDDSTKDKQEALDRRYIRMASIWAENSYCQRRQVGALIVKDKMIISDGYNGTPSGFENVCCNGIIVVSRFIILPCRIKKTWIHIQPLSTL